MERRIKLVLAYLGTPFHGWQRQQGQRSVQGELEAALTRMTAGLRRPVVGAGRTDAGVHAAGQAAHVDLPESLPLPGLIKGLNGTLPPEIRVRRAVAVARSFHARNGARAKHHVYRARWHEPELPWHGYGARQYDPEPLADGRVVEMSFDLYPTAWYFQPGHKIRVSIAGADLENFELNPVLCPGNEPSACTPTTLELHRGPVRASRIDLPVIRSGEND